MGAYCDVITGVLLSETVGNGKFEARTSDSVYHDQCPLLKPKMEPAH